MTNELITIEQRNDIEAMYPKEAEYIRENLVPYRHCNRCGSCVLKSELEQYPYQCIYCDEDLFEIETYLDEEKEQISDFDFSDMVETLVASGYFEHEEKPEPMEFSMHFTEKDVEFLRKKFRICNVTDAENAVWEMITTYIEM